MAHVLQTLVPSGWKYPIASAWSSIVNCTVSGSTGSYGPVTATFTGAAGRCSAPFASGTGCDWRMVFNSVDTGSGGSLGFGIGLTGGTDARIWTKYNNVWYRGIISAGVWSFSVIAGSSAPDGYPPFVRVVVAAGAGARNVTVSQSPDGIAWDTIDSIGVDAAVRLLGGTSGIASVRMEYNG